MDNEESEEEAKLAEFEERVSYLGKIHAHILFWIGWDVPYTEIGTRLYDEGLIKKKWSGNTVQRELTAIYEALEFPKSMGPVSKNDMLFQYAVPAIKRLTNNDPANLHKFPLKVKPKPEDRQSVNETVDKNRQWIDKYRQYWWIPLAAVSILVLLVGVFLLGRGTAQPVATTAPTQEVVSSPTSQPSVGGLPSETIQPPLPTDTEVPINTPSPTPTSEPTFTPAPADTQSLFGLQVGDVLSDDKVTLALTKTEFYEGYDRIARKIAAISYWFDFTNHSGVTILLRVDGSNFKVADNLGVEYSCVFEDGVYIETELDKSIENGNTLQILLRCGPNQEIGDDVNEITLTVSGSEDLIESTWVVVP